MGDHELNAIFLALEAAYDTLKQPVGAYWDTIDFEIHRRNAVEKLIRAMKAMDLDFGSISDQSVFAIVPAKA